MIADCVKQISKKARVDGANLHGQVDHQPSGASLGDQKLFIQRDREIVEPENAD